MLAIHLLNSRHMLFVGTEVDENQNCPENVITRGHALTQRNFLTNICICTFQIEEEDLFKLYAGLEPEKILGARKYSGQLCYIMQWLVYFLI